MGFQMTAECSLGYAQCEEVPAVKVSVNMPTDSRRATSRGEIWRVIR